MNEAAPRRSIFGSVMLIGGGLAAVGGAIFAVRKSNKTVEDLSAAINGTAPPAQPAEPDAEPSSPVEAGTGGYVNLRTTGYWPFTARADEQTMEGGTTGAAGWHGKRVVDPATGKRVQLVTVEMHRANPTQYPAVSLSGDSDVWPWGQKIVIPWSDGKTITGRIVDTGSHFHGLNKIYRTMGYEPVDVCVQSSSSKVPGKVTAQVIAGDNWEGGRAISAGGLKGQTVTAGELTEARTSDDYEALARSLESELGGRPREEQIVAGWAIRNRADVLGVSVSDLLAPNGQYGSPQSTGGFTSTRRPSTEKSREASVAVLGASSDTDPTDGAVDFWVPAQQARMRILGDVYRAAAKNGDVATAQKYVRFAGYGSEGDVRVKQAKDGMRLIDVVGSVELLGKIR